MNAQKQIVYNGYKKEFTLIDENGKKHSVLGGKAVQFAKIFLAERESITEQKKSLKSSKNNKKSKKFNFKNIKL